MKNVEDTTILSMKEAMEFLTERGFSCKSRATFYRIISDFNIPYSNANPNGKHEIRRFPLHGLKQFLKDQGMEV